MRRENVERMKAVFGIIMLTSMLILFFYTHSMYIDNMTKAYSMYNEIKGYTKIAELEEYLVSNSIRYERKIGDIYVYDDSFSPSKIQFITLGEDCQIVPAEYAMNFERLDNKEDVVVMQKNGKENISFIKDGKKYEYSGGNYYIVRNISIAYKIAKVICTIFVIAVDVFICVIFFSKEKSSEKSSD